MDTGQTNKSSIIKPKKMKIRKLIKLHVMTETIYILLRYKNMKTWFDWQ